MTRVQLQSLQVTGFKSFPDSVKLDFAGRVSAIIGPNGCGKSNVVDAVLWVLGEQSPKTLRLKNMGDVVFSGAAGRAAAGAAEVVLKLASDDGRWEATGGQLEIRRRVFRTGPSEYRVNGKVKRLRDVMDELMAVGLGTRDYAIIEQGRVGQVLSARPTDRRVLLEEAAGITHYKARRHEAELKLEHTRQNLLRIEDVISEVDRSLRQLRRQAKQADRHQKMQEKLDDRLLRLFTLEAHELDGSRQEISRRRATVQNDVAAAASALGGAEADLTDARDQQETDREETDAARAEVAGLLASRERLEAFLERSADLLDTLRAGLDRSRREHAALEGNRGSVEVAAAESASRLEAMSKALEEVSKEVEQAAGEEAEAQRLVAETEAEAGQRRQELLRTISTLTDSRNRLGALEREGDRLAYAVSQLEQELARQEERRSEVSARYAAAADESRTASAAADQLAGERESIHSSRAELQAEAMSARHQAEKFGHTAWDLRHRLAGIDRELARHAAAVDQVSTFLPREAIIGQVSDFLDPQPEVAAHLDRVWAEELELPVMRAEVLSPAERRAAAAVHGRIRLAVAAAAPPPPSSLDLPGARPLINAAGINDDQLGWLSRVLTPAYACDDAEQARHLAEQHPNVLILDPDGLLWRGRTLELPSAAEAVRGALALKADKNELQTSLDKAVADSEASTSRHQELIANLEELDRRLAEVDGRGVEAEQERARAGAVENSLSQELSRLEREIESLRAEIARNRSQVAELKQRHQKLTTEVAELDGRGLELEQAVEKANTVLDSRRGGHSEAVRRLDRWRAEAKLAGEREAAGRSEAERLEEERRQLGERLERLTREAGEMAEELERTETEVVRSRGRLAEEHGLLSAARERERVVGERLEAASERVSSLDTEVRNRRRQHEESREVLHQVEVELTRVQAQWEGLSETALNELTLSPEQLLGREVGENDQVEPLREEITKLRAGIDKMGPVNLLALKEAEELAERSTFLKTQRNDLVQALQSIDSTIQEIDATCTERFVDTFEKVNVLFAETFELLFGGGTTRLELVDEDDPLESGIDITAQPPGKKTQSVQLLSGGEKALTALSLLIALFRIKPSPFCILDEVDAPLDDANVERLADLVRAMTDHTQFILVTHNRRTMARADVLYGITMEEAGVSKVVSVRLED